MTMLQYFNRLAAVSFLMLAGCTSINSMELVGSEWRPTQIGSSTVSSRSKLLLRFDDGGKLSGYGGCNRFFGQYTISGNKIRIGPVGSTRMACPKPVMDMETALFAALETAKMFLRSKTNLVLLDADREEQARLIQTDG